jgi:hypothetical protein
MDLLRKADTDVLAKFGRQGVRRLAQPSRARELRPPALAPTHPLYVCWLQSSTKATALDREFGADPRPTRLIGGLRSGHVVPIHGR